MITYSGLQIPPGSKLAPSPADVAVAMCRITRYAGARWCPLAAHSILVAELCFRHSDSLLHWSQGLLHDAHETVTGEGVSFYKLPEMEAVEARLDQAIFPAFGLDYAIYVGARSVIAAADQKAVAIEQQLLGVLDWAQYYEARKGKPAPTFTPYEFDLADRILESWSNPTMVNEDSIHAKLLTLALEFVAASDPGAARKTLLGTLGAIK